MGLPVLYTLCAQHRFGTGPFSHHMRIRRVRVRVRVGFELRLGIGKSSESVQCAMLKACDACANKTWASYSALYQFGILS